jgi:hypothetical protein
MAVHDHSESTAAIAAKLTPPAGISLASVAGIQVSDLVLWTTLIYTVLLICHKIYLIYKDIRDRNKLKED